jgi:hypothetical protein
VSVCDIAGPYFSAGSSPVKDYIATSSLQPCAVRCSLSRRRRVDGVWFPTECSIRSALISDFNDLGLDNLPVEIGTRRIDPSARAECPSGGS